MKSLSNKILNKSTSYVRHIVGVRPRLKAVKYVVDYVENQVRLEFKSQMWEKIRNKLYKVS